MCFNVCNIYCFSISHACAYVVLRHHLEYRTQSTAIYRLLDWSKPGKAIVVSAACVFFVFLVHFLVFCLYRCRVCIFTKFCIRQRPFQNYHHSQHCVDQMILSNNKVPKMSRTPSSYDESKQEQFFNNPHTSVEFK